MLTQVFFQSMNKYILGVLNMDSNKTHKAIVVLVPGFAQSKSDIDYFMTRLSHRLIDEGYATFQIDLYGHGDSWGNYEEVNREIIINNIQDAVGYIKNHLKDMDIVIISRGIYGNFIINSELGSIYKTICINPVINKYGFTQEKYNEKIVSFNDLFEHNKYEKLVMLIGGEILNVRALSINTGFLNEILGSFMVSARDNDIISYNTNASIDEQAVCSFLREYEWQSQLMDNVINKVNEYLSE